MLKSNIVLLHFRPLYNLLTSMNTNKNYGIIIKCLISDVHLRNILIFFSHGNVAIKRKTLPLILKDNSFVQNRAGDSCDLFFKTSVSRSIPLSLRALKINYPVLWPPKIFSANPYKLRLPVSANHECEHEALSVIR